MLKSRAAAGALSYLVGRWWFWTIFVGLAFGVPLARSITHVLPPMPPVVRTLPAFSLVREDGAPFGSRELANKVWVASFVDERGGALQTTLELERRMRKLGDAFHIVSFTIDPDHDSPARLLELSRAQHANPRRWTFVTGPRPELARLLADGFGVALAGSPPSPALPLVLVLVDGRGRVRGSYDVASSNRDSDRDALESLIFDAALLVNNY